MRKALSAIGETIRFGGVTRSAIGPDFGLILPREGLLSYIKEVDGTLIDTTGVSPKTRAAVTTADWYVVPDPINGPTKICYSSISFEDALTANTNKTFVNLNSSAIAGDSIILGAGTYSLELYLNNITDVYCSGDVILSPTTTNGILLTGANPTTFYGPLTLTGGAADSFGYPIQRTTVAGDVTFNRLTIKKFRSANRYISNGRAGTWIFNNCDFSDIFSMSSSIPTPRMLYVTDGDYIFNQCVMHYGSYMQFAISGSVTLNNNLFLSPGGISSTNHAMAFDTNGATVVSQNNIYIGCIPVLANATSFTTLTSDNDFFTTNPGHATETLFDTRGLATITNRLSYVDPKFTEINASPKNGVVIGIDDAAQLTAAYGFAQDYTVPNDMVVSFAMNTGQDYVVGGWTSDIVDKLRWLINNGQEVAAHGSNHSGLINLDCGYAISATGTSPTLTTTASRSGDSSTWSGSLSVTINGSTLGPLAFADYPTMEDLFGYLSGKSVGDGTITVTNPGAFKSPHLASVNLDVVTSASISSTYTPQLDEDATVQTEIVESVLDLQSYINSGTDRNGNNAVTGMTESAPSPAYICRIYRSPNGQKNATARTVLESGTGTYYGGDELNVLCAAATGDGESPSDTYRSGDSTKGKFDIYNILYNQVSTDNQLFSQLAYMSTHPGVAFALWHGTPTYGGTEQGLIDLFKIFEASKYSAENIINDIRTSGDWVDAGDSYYYYSGDPDDVLSNADYSLAISSPFINAGIDPYTNGDGDQYDIEGYMVWSDTFDAPVYHWRDGVDIGPYTSGRGSKVYNHPVTVSGSGFTGIYTLPICPTLLDADQGNTLYSVAYAPQQIDLSTFVDTAWMRAGTKGWVIYNTDQDAATIAKIDKYIGN